MLFRIFLSWKLNKEKIIQYLYFLLKSKDANDLTLIYI